MLYARHSPVMKISQIRKEKDSVGTNWRCGGKRNRRRKIIRAPSQTPSGSYRTRKLSLVYGACGHWVPLAMAFSRPRSVIMSAVMRKALFRTP